MDAHLLDKTGKESIYVCMILKLRGTTGKDPLRLIFMHSMSFNYTGSVKQDNFRHFT